MVPTLKKKKKLKKKKGEAEVQANLFPMEQKQRKPEARDPGTKCRTTCLLSKLILGDLEHLWPFLSRQPPLRDRPCSYQHGPFRPWPWTCDILDSFCSQLWLNVTHLFRCLSGKKSRWNGKRTWEVAVESWLQALGTWSYCPPHQK